MERMASPLSPLLPTVWCWCMLARDSPARDQKHAGTKWSVTHSRTKSLAGGAAGAAFFRLKPRSRRTASQVLHAGRQVRGTGLGCGGTRTGARVSDGGRRASQCQHANQQGRSRRADGHAPCMNEGVFVAPAPAAEPRCAARSAGQSGPPAASSERVATATRRSQSASPARCAQPLCVRLARRPHMADSSLLEESDARTTTLQFKDELVFAPVTGQAWPSRALCCASRCPRLC